MKNAILILFLLVASFVGQAQTVEDQPQLVTVKDTSFIQDERLQFMTTTILPAITNFMDSYNRKQKVAGVEITKKQETSALMRKWEKALEEYALSFRVIKDVEIDSAQIVKEYEALNTRINQLNSDPDAKYIETMQEFKRIQERQAVLQNYYMQLQKK